ncbi:MAG: peptide deformylase, partial [Candidatus Competibacteraceae bacterium]
MARLNILHFPDPRLRKRALPVETVDESVRSLVNDMLETMYAAPGIGLAATQVNVQKRPGPKGNLDYFLLLAADPVDDQYSEELPVEAIDRVVAESHGTHYRKKEQGHHPR